jgi:hypothetical protein
MFTRPAPILSADTHPAPGWTYRRLLIRTPSGYRLTLEGPSE